MGIELGSTGAIKVDKYMRTNIPDIFVAGDCCETTHLVCNKQYGFLWDLPLIKWGG